MITIARAQGAQTALTLSRFAGEFFQPPPPPPGSFRVALGGGHYVDVARIESGNVRLSWDNGRIEERSGHLGAGETVHYGIKAL